MSASAVVPGHLYVVATPIGNLGDLSPRAQAVLAAVDRVCAEDTRTSGALLAHFGIRRPMQALHEHNEDQVAGELIEALRRGQSLALVSDAGTPLVSDPGFALVRAARAAGLPVIAIPGPCAAVAALSIAGIASDSFVFIGFLPSKAQARRTRLQELATEPRTLLFYESSHRIADSLRDIVAVFGGARRLCLARELSKLYEESITAAAAEVADWLAQDANRSRGEFVLVVEGTTAQGGSDDAEAGRVLKILLAELGAAQAARLAAAITGRRKNELYALATARNAADAE
ncbi:MAG TPA: 16S rRNA (cytidine(1402)-2'-O)-methyltransferase [Stenotrophobium sp.]|nr:16S rRNA (cytidine(1402)-2'-O)-methyltransferase [Stenotrophobium sp.]